MKLKLLFATAFLALGSLVPAFGQQERCASNTIWQAKADADPSYRIRRDAAEVNTQNWIAAQGNALRPASVVTIPTVVHIVYNNSTENVSDAQIMSQITALNEDFRRLNTDALGSSHPFYPVTADCELEFCLASVDPSGNTTTGITRTSTTHGPFVNNNADDIKFTQNGGHDNWDPTKYLNIWVGDLGNALYGYATFPSELATDPAYDGVVINYTAFGTMGTAQAPSDLGRTTTHEIGHWLDLSHIWGDQTCGDDLVADTEPAEQDNYGCFTFPHNPNSTCGSGPNGEMYMNYMDYTDDNCMAMFTLGQKQRMYAALNTPRVGLLTAGGCLSTSAQPEAAGSLILVAPNPSQGQFIISTNKASNKASIVVLDALGHEVMRQDRVSAFPYTLDLSTLPSNIYFLKVVDGNRMHTQKIILAH